MPFVYLDVMGGRKPEQKSELAKAITKDVARILGCEERKVFIIFRNVPQADFFVGGSGVAPEKIYRW